MNLTATIEGIGFWCRGLPSWEAAREYVRDGVLADGAPTRPSPQLLAPNERRRAPETVAVALEVALAACNAAGRDPRELPSVFASTHGDLAITDYMCATLADAPRTISPTRFHNSVHNAAAGYWTIGAGCIQAASAISAYDATFAEGLIEALAQLATGTEAVLLVAYDSEAPGPLAPLSRSSGLLGGALVLSRTPRAGAPTLRIAIEHDATPTTSGALAKIAGGNGMAPMLPLFEALSRNDREARVHAGCDRTLRVELVPAELTRMEAVHA
jgi:hypothetical protein